jgi:DNA (cytosine-5)-methyltransferase 1
VTAYYNEFDPKAAAWLRELIRQGHIAPGDVDERSIADVRPTDLAGYTQCHFFAGIGVWSHALRRAGWADDRPVWTGSCPCQPFSAAGKGGGFDDERHLWPHFHWLISQCRPDIVFGEQVASTDGLAWIDLVQADLEGTGYASGAVDFCSAGVGAPHIRQRLYWFGERLEHSASDGRVEWRPEPSERSVVSGREPGWLDDAGLPRLEGQRGGYSTPSGRIGTLRPTPAASELGGLADAQYAQRGAERQIDADAYGRDGPGRSCDVGRMEHADGPRRGQGQRNDTPSGHRPSSSAASLDDRFERTGPTNGLWGSADWLHCRDHKWRPVEPGTFPLAHGAPARVGRLRGYGNAINAEAATVFIEAYLETKTIDVAPALPARKPRFNFGKLV